MLKLTQQQKLLQRLSPAQIQLMKLLQLPITALEQRIKEELEQNPALEEGEETAEEETLSENEEKTILENNVEEENLEDEFSDDIPPNEQEAASENFDPQDYLDDERDIAYYKMQIRHQKGEDEREMPIASSVSFQETLLAQLENLKLNPHQRQLAEYLLGCLDEDGYLRRELSSIADDLAFSQNVSTTPEELEEVLLMIQEEFEPAGIGARSLQECLKIQLERKRWTESRALALKIIEEQMPQFSRKHYHKIARHFALSEDDPLFKKALQEILKLNPRPGGSARQITTSAASIIPDFIITNHNGVLEVSLHPRNMPELRIANIYQQMLKEYSERKDKTGKEAAQFVKQKIESAKQFIQNIKERQHTLQRIMEAIVEWQKEYFLTGDELTLKPMVLRDIAEKTGLDISTVSRVTSTKYAETPFGTILLKTLFNEALTTTEGEDISSKMIKKIIADSVAAEDKKKPLTDEALTRILNKQGYVIARRTVAKYREMLNIPVARLRKQV